MAVELAEDQTQQRQLRLLHLHLHLQEELLRGMVSVEVKGGKEQLYALALTPVRQMANGIPNVFETGAQRSCIYSAPRQS